MRRALALALALAACAATPAAAFDPAGPVTPFPAAGQRALQQSPGFWGSNPCPNGYTERYAPYSEVGAPMSAAPGTCTIYWDPALAPTSPLEWCVTVLHEGGHLRGIPHDNNPWSVMYQGPRIIVLSGRFHATNNAEGWCYGRGFYRTRLAS
jgi:hypothetical protein